MQEVSLRQVKDLVGGLGNRLVFRTGSEHRPIRVYGIPRGGAVVAMLLEAKFSPAIVAVDRPEDAHVLVDDLLDSGRTRDQWVERIGLPFDVLYTKTAEDGWVVFPWEKAEGKAAEATSGEDIAVRLLEYIGEDPNRGGLRKTPERFVKAWQHWTRGYGMDAKEFMRTFEDGAEGCDEMIVLRGIPLWSHCEHHLAPFFGVAHVGYVPDKRILGLSKISRVIDVFAHRLQVQERLTNQVADALQDGLRPRGVGVLLECRHTCMESRGIEQAGIVTSTCALRGVFRSDGSARAEFLAGVRAR